MANLTPLRRLRQTLRGRRCGLGVLAVGAGIAVVAAGCGSGTPNSTSTSSAGAGGTAAIVSTASNASLGQVLVDSHGFTLYYFKLDTPTKSNCTGSCATTWPPLLLPAGVTTPTGSGVSGLGTIMLPDGSHQVTYHGHPLYTYAGDSAAGQTNGQGIDNDWYAQTTGSSTGSGATTTTKPSSGYGY
jgi:predicted lipoprotein with Yx(FWY)xxD motif